MRTARLPILLTAYTVSAGVHGGRIGRESPRGFYVALTTTSGEGSLRHFGLAAGSSCEQSLRAIGRDQLALILTAVGQYLTDGDGRALYMFTADKAGESRCYDRCAEAWPPMITSEALRKGEKVNQRMVNTIRRKDNRQQVSYNSMPLYYYARDQGSGSTLGQDVKGGGGEWYLVSPEGRPIKEQVKS